MEIKIGDKVRFLDAVGGGVVTAFQGKDVVLVLDNDGFEVPVLKRQCVVVETAKAEVKPERTSTVVLPQTEKILPKAPAVPETREGEMLNLSLAFLPGQEKSFTDCEFECYLINDSNYTLLFNYASCSGKTWKSRRHGMIEPNSKLFLEEFGRETISELDKIGFQCLAFKPSAFYGFKNSISVELRLDTVKFYKIHCFKENDYFDEDALVVSLVKRDVPEKSFLVAAEDLTTVLQEKESGRSRTSEPLPGKKAGLLEVDLHINSLLDSTAGMSSADMLKYQMDVFNRTMAEHRNQKRCKIVFIHGKGDGVLRAAILAELKSKYKTCKWQDASFREYGFGATLVTLY